MNQDNANRDISGTLRAPITCGMVVPTHKVSGRYSESSVHILVTELIQELENTKLG